MFDLRVRLNRFKWFVNLFPKLVYLKSGINLKEIRAIIRFLLLKSNNNT